MGVSDTHVFAGFLTAVLTQLSFQGHQQLFSHASAEEIRQKENSPQPGIKLTTTRSWVRPAHYWATPVGLFFRDCVKRSYGDPEDKGF